MESFSMLKTVSDKSLEAWRKQYLFDAMISENEEQMDLEDIYTVDAKALLKSVSSFDTKLAVGQIRIMTSAVTLEPKHIPFVAILGRWTESSWLVAPFSRFTIPAVRGEMLTGIDYDFHAVLQCWNAKIIPSILLQKSWKCGELPEQVRIDAYDLFRHLATNTPLMETFQSAIGPALTDPLDFRNDYMAEDKEQFQPLDNRIAMVNQIAASNFEAIQIPEQQAAAGDELQSQIFIYQNDDITYFRNAEAINFEPVPAKSEAPQFIWTASDVKDKKYDGAELMFRDKKTGLIIGSGEAKVDANGLSLIMFDPIIADSMPAIERVGNIQIILNIML